MSIKDSTARWIGILIFVLLSLGGLLWGSINQRVQVNATQIIELREDRSMVLNELKHINQKLNLIIDRIK